MKIIWTDTEREKLINLVALMLSNQPGDSLITLLNRAQEQLPAVRRRKISQLVAVPWLVEGVRERMAVWKTAAEDAQKLHNRVVALEQSNGLTTTEILDKYTMTVLEHQCIGDLVRYVVDNYGVASVLSEINMSAIIGHVAESLMSLLEGRLSGLQMLDLLIKQHTPEPVAKRVSVPRIVVYGPKGNQAEELRREFKDRLEIICIDHDLRRIEADEHVCWVRFMSHAKWRQVETWHGRVVLYSKGFNGLKDLLRRYT